MKFTRGGGYWESKSKYGLIGKAVVLGVAAIWDYRKGLQDLIKLSQELSSNYKVVVVGVSKKQLIALPKNVIGISHTNNTDELVELYAISDVFVNPTIEDNYPTTNLEAIASGTPVITYETGGSPESANMYGTSITRDFKVLIENVETMHKYAPCFVDIDYINVVANYLKLYK